MTDTGRPIPMTVTPQFPGGMDVAPEVAAGGGCAHAPCTCAIEAGRAFCCRACARAGEDTDRCQCGHFGCTDRTF